MWRKFIIPLGIAALAWLSMQWLDEQQARAPAPEVAEGRESPDAYMEGIVMRSMNADGRPGHEVRAARAEHFERGDRTEFEAPFISFYRPDGRLWTLAAERGVARDGDREILLQGEVLIRRPSDPARPRGEADLRVRTRELRILSDEEFAETDQPATIEHRYGRVDAVGMKVWFKQERLQLLSQVHGIYETSQ